MKMEDLNRMTFCSAFSRYLFFGFNLVLFLAGLALIGLGAFTQITFDHYSINEFINQGSFIVPFLILFVGFIISFIAFFGCCGAAKNSFHRLLYAYAFFIGLLFAVEIATGVVSFVYRQDINHSLENGLESVIDDYKNDTIAARIMKEIEYDFHCCGAKGPSDYSDHGIPLPNSCCKGWAPPCEPQNIIQIGCAHAIKPFLMEFSLILAIISGFIVFVQIFGIVTSIMIARHIRRGYQIMES